MCQFSQSQSQAPLTKMRSPTASFAMPSLTLIISFLFSFLWATLADNHHLDIFLQCLALRSGNATSISQVIYTQSQSNSSYSSILELSRRNARCVTPTTLKPLAIVRPFHVSHIQATINCSRDLRLQIRIRSGGHDYEGLSYVSQVPFIMIDLINLRAIVVDTENETARVQAGASLGELYYKIAEKSPTLAFPAGVCPTVGVGGHFSGGGYGMLMRKFGLAADHIIDAHLVDVNGRLLDRNSMGEDLFWAIRGGGGGSFGVIVSWKVKLVSVPSTVTVFTVKRTLEQNATMLVNKWQSVAENIHEDLYIRLFVRAVNSTRDEGKTTIQASFTSLFLGRIDQLIPLMQESFPELGLVKEDCIEMSWIQSILYFADIPSISYLTNILQSESLGILLDRTVATGTSWFFKGKSDYVEEPIPETALEGLWQWFYEEPELPLELIFSPYGGIMNKISESEIPYPHRAGNLFNIHYSILWAEDASASQKHVSLLRRLYKYMKIYVSKYPRAACVSYRDLELGINSYGDYTSYEQASEWGVKSFSNNFDRVIPPVTYMNYRDLDLGINGDGNSTSYIQACKWGLKYFGNNFNRLVLVKTLIDPQNFFRHEQSIPSLLSK